MKTSELTSLIKKANNVVLAQENAYNVNFPEMSVTVAFNPESEHDLRVFYSGNMVLESSSKTVVESAKRILKKRHEEGVKEHKRLVKKEFNDLTSKILNGDSKEDDGVLDLNSIVGL